MSGILQVIKSGFDRYMKRLARDSVRQDLLARSDRFLDDIGVSRKLLEQGVDAWPWKEVAAVAPQPLKLVGGVADLSKKTYAASSATEHGFRDLRAA